MIEQELYKKIIENIPICCVDLIIINQDNQFLVLKRANEPAKGSWWLPGGRILKNESISIAAVRKAKEETGLKCVFVKTIGVAETIFDTGPFGDPIHTINAICLLNVNKKDVIIDETSTDFKWCDKIDKSLKLHKEIIKYLKLTGF